MLSLVRTGALCALIASTLTVPASAKSQSFWVDLETGKVIARVCPEGYRAVFGDRKPEELDEPIAIIRARETLVTMEVSTKGDRKAAETAMEAYKANIARQIEEGAAQMGCDALLMTLGFKQPGRPVVAPSREQLVQAARRSEIPSTARPADLPAEERIGTEAAYPLQRLLLTVFADPKDRACDPKTAKVTPFSRETIDAENVPPFVGTPTRFTETWSLRCKGEAREFKVEFTQDARSWKRYAIR